MKRSAVGFILVIVWSVLGGTLPVQAQRTGWSPPIVVSDIQKTPSSWFPDIAIGPDGSVHIIWSTGLPGEKKEEAGTDLLMYRTLRDGKWSPVNDIANPGKGGYTVRNSIAMGHDGKLAVLYRQGLITVFISAPWDRAWSAGAWSAARSINSGGSYYNTIATDSKGTLHILWNEAIPDDPKDPEPACSFCSDIFYRASNDGGRSWTAPINLSQSVDGSVKQQMKIGKNDSLHVVWEEGYDWYAGFGEPKAGIYRRSLDGGKTWEQPVRFTLPNFVPESPAETPVPDATPEPTPAPVPDAPQQMTLGLYQNSQPVVVYRGTASDRIYYQFSRDEGKTWSASASIPGVRARNLRDTPVDAYTMTTDGAGNVHFIGAGYLSGDDIVDTSPKLLHLVWNGQVWSNPEVIAADEHYPDLDQVTIAGGKRMSVFPEWPRALVAGNSLHLTWFTRNDSDLSRSDHAHYQVWYSVKQLDAPALAALPLFTPVPTAAPQAATATPILPTATPLPASIADAPLVEGSAAWEGPGVITMAIAALPALGLLGLIVGARALFVRRRQRLSG
jgi:hypothetical protein